MRCKHDQGDIRKFKYKLENILLLGPEGIQYHLHTPKHVKLKF